MPSPTTWDTSGTYASLLLSSLAFSEGNTVVTASENQSQVCGLNPLSSGKYLFEVSLDNSDALTNSSQIAYGVCATDWTTANGTTVWENFAQNGVNVALAFGNLYLNANGNSSTQINLGSASSFPCVVQIVFDFDNRLVWAKIASNANWNNNILSNPATGENGLSFSSLSGPYVPVVGFQVITGSPKVTINAGPIVDYAPPEGFGGWPISGSTAVPLFSGANNAVSKQTQYAIAQPSNAVKKQTQYTINQPKQGLSKQTEFVVEQPLQSVSKQTQYVVFFKLPASLLNVNIGM